MKFQCSMFLQQSVYTYFTTEQVQTGKVTRCGKSRFLCCNLAIGILSILELYSMIMKKYFKYSVLTLVKRRCFFFFRRVGDLEKCNHHILDRVTRLYNNQGVLPMLAVNCVYHNAQIHAFTYLYTYYVTASLYCTLWYFESHNFVKPTPKNQFCLTSCLGVYVDEFIIFTAIYSIGSLLMVLEFR